MCESLVSHIPESKHKWLLQINVHITAETDIILKGFQSYAATHLGHVTSETEA